MIIKKGLKIIAIILLIDFLLWFGASYVDVVIHNLTPGYEHPFWNILAMGIK